MTFVYRNLGKRLFFCRIWGLGWEGHSVRANLWGGRSVLFQRLFGGESLWRGGRISVLSVPSPIMILRICLGKVSMDSFSCHSGGLQLGGGGSVLFSAKQALGRI